MNTGLEARKAEKVEGGMEKHRDSQMGFES